MRIRSAAISALATLFAVHAVLAQSAAPVHAFISNGMKAVVEELQPEIERAAGHPLAITWGTTTGLKQRVANGEPFDFALMTTEAIDELMKSGMIAAGSRVELARSGIGVGVRAGAAKPGIETPESLKQTLQKARSITFAGDGASRPFLEKMFASMGIADAIKPKILLTQGSAAANANVSDGKAEIVMTLVSEIVGVPGVDLAGPLPKEVQNYVNFTAGVSAKAANAEAARQMLKALTGATAAPVYKAKGMEAR
jgi:molybdate transport system substrate-binding protein